MIENLFTFVRTLGNQRIEGKKFFVTQVGLLGTVSDNSGSIGTAGKVLSSTGSGVEWITVGSSNVQSLNDLTDVVINTAVEGNLLRYNGTSWVNWAPNFLTSYGSLNDLSDVTLTTPVDGSRLVYVHSTGQWIDAAPLALNKIYYGTALGDSQTSTVVTNGTRLGVGTLAMATNLTVGQVDITDGLIGNGSVHIGGVNDNDTYLLASNNKIQVGSQETEVIPGEEGGEEPQTQTTFTPSTLNIQPLGGQTVFGGSVTATGFKTPAGIKKQILLADGTVSSTNAATSGQILRWIESGGIGQWVADDEGVSGIPSLQEVTDVGSTTTDTITAGGFSTAGSVTASTVTTPLIEREGILTINSEQQVDQGEPNPDLLYVSWLGDNKFVVDADGYAIATTGFKVVGGTASGFLKADGTIDTSTYITSYTETQTLDDVTTLGSTTANTITVGGVISPTLSYNGLLTINADSGGGLQPGQGDPAVPVLSFQWAGNQQGYIDTDGKITFNGFKTPLGTSSGFLKANGTVDTNAYITGVEYIDDIGDVNLVSPATGDVLMFDGAEWVNSQIQTDYTSKVQHEVKAGVAIAKGKAVYVTSADGTNMIVGLASNTSEATSSKTMGLALTSAAVNGKFFVVTEGLIAGLNTASATAGQPVWLGTNGNLIFGLTNKPVAPAHLVYLGVVTRANANNGEIFVHVQNGFELNEIHDALITSPAVGQLLRRDSDGLWKNWTPNYITASSSDVLTNKRIELSTGITSATAIDSLDPFLGQNDIALYQDGIDKGGKINVLEETGEIVVSSAGIGYYSGLTTTEGGSRFLVTVAGNTLTGTLAEFNEALVDGDFATQSYVSTQIANLVDSAPATLNTLNELAAALGDDPNFATTVATSIGLKQDKLNGVGFVKANGTTISYDNSTYITSESDPVFVGSAAYGITNEDIISWNDAYSWGNHAEAGYLTTIPDHTHIIADVTGLQAALNGKADLNHTHDDRYYTESEIDSLLTGKVSTDNFKVLGGGVDYDTNRTLKVESGLAIYGAYSGGDNSPFTYDIAAQFAFGSRAFEFSADWINDDGANLKLRTLRDCCQNWSPWVDVITSYNISQYALTSLPAHSHTIADVTGLQTALDGKLSSESDPFFTSSPAAGITNELIQDWNSAFGWGDHSTFGYLTSLPAHSHDDRYYTETESDARFYLATNPSDYQTTTGTVANVASGAISNLSAAWTAPGTSISNGFRVYRYNADATNKPVTQDNANWLINIYSHPTGGTASYGHQLAAANNNNIYFRSVSNGSFSDWHKFWSTNDFSSTTVSNWNTAYGWGNHASAGYLTAEADTLASVTARGGITSSEVAFGANSGGDRGIQIKYGSGVNDYGRIRFYQNDSNHSTIHSFSQNWQSGTIFTASSGAINFAGQRGVTFGAWNDPAVVFEDSGINYFKNNVGIGTTAPQQKLDVFGNISLGSWTKSGSTYVGLRRADDGSFGGGGDSGLVIESYNHESPYNGNYSQRVHLRTHLYNGGSHNVLTAYGVNVGIGNTNPTAKLQVGPEAHPNATGIEVAAGAGGANLLARDANTHHNWFPYTNGDNYYSAGAHHFRSAEHGTPWVIISASDFTWGGNTVATRTWVQAQGYLTSLPAHNHDNDYVNVAGDRMSGDLTLKYTTANTSDYNGLMFAPYSDADGLNDYIIKAASDKGVFGRKSFGWHVHSQSAFGVYSNGWVQLFGVEGGTGNTQVFGNLTVSGSITESSSIRYKKDVVDIESASAKVEQLKPVRYKKIKDDQEEIGLIAEDVAELFPEVVKYDKEGRPDGVNYSRLSVILLKAVQELTERVNKLENK